MNSRSLPRGLAAACTALAIAICTQSVPASANDAATVGHAWFDNGASACEKYLTPEFLATILVGHAEKAQRIDATSCHSGIVYLALKVADVDVFRGEIPMIFGAHQVGGIGDAAFWNQAGALSAVKGHNRGCDFGIVGVREQLKIHDAELGQKFGEICNKLFALP